MTYASFLAFPDSTMTVMVSIGLSISFFSASYYAFDQYKKERAKTLKTD